MGLMDYQGFPDKKEKLDSLDSLVKTDYQAPLVNLEPWVWLDPKVWMVCRVFPVQQVSKEIEEVLAHQDYPVCKAFLECAD